MSRKKKYAHDEHTTSVENDEERKADMMKWADRKAERKKREHEQPLVMNLDKEKRPTRGESLSCLSLLLQRRRREEQVYL